MNNLNQMYVKTFSTGERVGEVLDGDPKRAELERRGN